MKDKLEIGSFSSLNETNDPNLYIAAKDRMDQLPLTREAREIMRTALSPRPGDMILDLGCGTGTESRELAKRVAPQGKVIGLDTSAAMVAEASKRAHNLGLALEFQIGDAADLPFSNGMFSGCRAERLFQHLSDPHRVVSEMVRVTRSGGQVAVMDVDGAARRSTLPTRA